MTLELGAERLLMSEPSKVHSLKFAKTPTSCFGHLLEAIPLMCPFSVLIRCETLTAFP